MPVLKGGLSLWWWGLGFSVWGFWVVGFIVYQKWYVGFRVLGIFGMSRMVYIGFRVRGSRLYSIFWAVRAAVEYLVKK